MSHSRAIEEEKRLIAELRTEIQRLQAGLRKASTILPATAEISSSQSSVVDNDVDAKEVITSLDTKLSALKREISSNLKLQSLIAEPVYLLENTMRDTDAFDRKTKIENEKASALLAEASRILKK